MICPFIFIIFFDYRKDVHILNVIFFQVLNVDESHFLFMKLLLTYAIQYLIRTRFLKNKKTCQQKYSSFITTN